MHVRDRDLNARYSSLLVEFTVSGLHVYEHCLYIGFCRQEGLKHQPTKGMRRLCYANREPTIKTNMFIHKIVGK